MTLSNRLRGIYANSRKAKGGNVVITFALSTIPIIGFVGAAVDYSRANSVKAAMQAAVDSTALMLSKDAQTLTTAQINTKATNYFNALFNRTEATNLVVTPTFTNPQAGSFRLDVIATANVPTTFTKVLGQSNLAINVNVGSDVGHEEARGRARPRQHRIDGVERQDDEPQDGGAKSADHAGDRRRQDQRRRQGRRSFRSTPRSISAPATRTTNLVRHRQGSTTQLQLEFGHGLQQQQLEELLELRARPHLERLRTTAATDAPIRELRHQRSLPVTTTAARCAASVPRRKLMPLSYDWNALNDKIDDMSPNGNTNVSHRSGLGMACADRRRRPLSDACRALAPISTRCIILLTDGDNTESWKNSNNTKVTSQSAIDARTTLACTNVKAANIKLYTIRVIRRQRDLLLQGCATNPTMFFDVSKRDLTNVQRDRTRTSQPAHRQMSRTPIPAHRPQNTKPGRAAGLFIRRLTATRLLDAARPCRVALERLVDLLGEIGVELAELGRLRRQSPRRRS